MPSRFTEVGLEAAHAASAARSWFEQFGAFVEDNWTDLNWTDLVPEPPPWAEDKALRATVAAALLGVACAALIARETLVRMRTRRLISAYGHAHAD